MFDSKKSSVISQNNYMNSAGNATPVIKDVSLRPHTQGVAF